MHLSPAKLNVAISTAAAAINIGLLILPYFARILLGPLPHFVIVCIYYQFRSVTLLIICLVATKTVLMTAFILDFDRMSGETMPTTVMTMTINTMFRVL
jgi:hypothetical protein